MKKIRLFLMIAVIVLLSFIYSNTDINQYIYDRAQDSSEYISTGILGDGEQLSQSFIVKENVFDGIKIKVSVSGQSDSVDVLFRLTSLSDGQAVFDEKVKASELKNGRFYEIKFPQLQNVSGKEFRLEIEEKGADVLNGAGFYRARQGKDGLSTGCSIKGEKLEETLVIRTISHRFDLETFVVLLAFVLYVVLFMKILYKLFK